MENQVEAGRLIRKLLQAGADRGLDDHRLYIEKRTDSTGVLVVESTSLLLFRHQVMSNSFETP